MITNLLEKLNQEQAQAVTHVTGPLMIVAGAGTGKTMVITHRIAWLIEQGLAKPEEILALTFTEKAASEMEERVDRLLPYGYVELQISTFHAFAEKLLRDYGVEIGLSRDFRVVSELDAWLLARKNFDRFKLDYFRPLGNPTKYIRSLLTHFSRAKDVGVDPEHYLKYVEDQRANLDAAQSDDESTSELKRLEELAGAYTTYQQILLENDCLDFGDLMLYTLKLLRERPKVRDHIRGRYKYVLVDEFQDTNDAQYEIVREIALPLNNLTVVGDDDQSIYRFRGASLANILRFEADYPQAKRVVLTANYRSAQNILDTAHAFIQHNNPNRLEASVNTLSKKLVSTQSFDGFIEHLHSSTSEEEVASVVKKILELREREPETSWNDFAILVRSNAAGTDFALAMDRHNIPYQFLALSGLYTKPAVLDMLALLRVVDNPFDSPSFYRLLTSPIVGLQERAIFELNRVANRKGKSLFEICEHEQMAHELCEGDRTVIRGILSKIKEFQHAAISRNVSELFVMIAKNSGYLERLNQDSERQKMESFGHLQQFYERLKSFERAHEHPILHNFLIEFTHERDAGEEGSLSVDLDAGPDMVRIMTIHASKGLEFRYVFVVNLVAQKFPTRAMRDPIELPEGLGVKAPEVGDAHIEEERRLFYVAMTRAKEGLFFASADDYGGTRKRKISQFLHELGYQQPSIREPITLELIDHDTTAPDESAPCIPLPKQFSFTQLAAYNACPLQYKFAHVLKVPVMGKWTFSFGKTMHNTLERFFRLWLERTGVKQTSLFETSVAQSDDGLPVSLDELLENYRVCWQDDWFTNDDEREKYRKQGKDSLRELYKRWEVNTPKPLFIETGFTLKLGDVVIKGRIDRIDAFEDGVEIIDYKTGTPKQKLEKEDKEQLFLYQLVARDVLGLIPKRLTYHYLQDNSCVSFLGNDEDLLDFQEMIVDRAKTIRDSKFDPSPGYQCRYCDFADICEFREK
jgi:DNA helicase-2/ATP-dependent DNA helicase PcrA